MSDTATIHFDNANPDLKALFALAAKGAGISSAQIQNPKIGNGTPASIPVGIKHGEEPELLDLSGFLEKYRTRPERKTGTAKAITLQSFLDLVDRHKTEHSAIFADTNWQKPSFTAVLDYHQKGEDGEPDNGKHRVHYSFPVSDEWIAWLKQDGERMSQGEFAAFLEERIAELAAPDEKEITELGGLFNTTFATPAELIQLARDLQINVDSKVRNAQVLQSGETNLVFEEQHTAHQNGAPIKVPGMFMLNIAPFFNGEKVRTPVRLRYRAQGGSIMWFYQLYRPDLVITNRVLEDLLTAGKETQLPVFEAYPEMQGI